MRRRPSLTDINNNTLHKQSSKIALTHDFTPGDQAFSYYYPYVTHEDTRSQRLSDLPWGQEAKQDHWELHWLQGAPPPPYRRAPFMPYYHGVSLDVDTVQIAPFGGILSSIIWSVIEIMFLG